MQDVKNEILVGLQNPVMQFYLNYGYDINLDASSLYVPDHIAIELGFMQKLVLGDEREAQIKFSQTHLLKLGASFFGERADYESQSILQ